MIRRKMGLTIMQLKKIIKSRSFSMSNIAVEFGEVLSKIN
jgi:hypothetical protein